MDKINLLIPGPTVDDSAFNAWAAVLAATSMLFFAPAVSADKLICEVAREDRPHRYLIDIDDGGRTVTVVNADTNQSYPVTAGELTPERVVLAFNGIRMDATKFVRQGKVVTMSLTTHAEAFIDRSTNTLIETGYVTDDKGEILSLETLRAMQTEEEARMPKKKSGPTHDPMFWLFLEVATYRHDGSCRAAPPQTSN